MLLLLLLLSLNPSSRPLLLIPVLPTFLSCSVVPSVFGAQLDRYINEIAMVLNTNLQDAANIDVQLAAARAFTTFIQSIQTAQRAAFTGLVPVVVQVS